MDVLFKLIDRIEKDIDKAVGPEQMERAERLLTLAIRLAEIYVKVKGL